MYLKNILSKKIKYPKLLLLILTFLVAYILFYGKTYPLFNKFIISTGYLGSFILGMFFVYGFTAAPATSILLILAKEQNIFLAALIAGFGALVGDLILFKFIRYSFSFTDEIKGISHEKVYVYLSGKINNQMPSLLKKYLAVIFAGFLIASPLPDEVGVSLLAFSNKISTKLFSILAYSLNTIGIFIILVIGKVI
jgi:hypothetical protein